MMPFKVLSYFGFGMVNFDDNFQVPKFSKFLESRRAELQESKNEEIVSTLHSILTNFRDYYINGAFGILECIFYYFLSVRLRGSI